MRFIKETALTKEMDKHDNALSFISSVTQQRRKGNIKINRDNEGVAKIRELVAAFHKRKARIKDKSMNKKVIEYFNNYLGGQLNENTADEQLNRAAIDLVILTETVIKFVELNEISPQLARKVFLARKAIAKNIRPDAYTGRSYTNKQIARKNKELIQRSPEGKKLIRKSSAEHLKNLQQKVMSRKPFDPSPTASAAERADAKRVGIEKLKKAAKSARTPKPVQVDLAGMPTQRSSTPQTVSQQNTNASTPKEKRSLSHKLGRLVGLVGKHASKPGWVQIPRATYIHGRIGTKPQKKTKNAVIESSYYEPEKEKREQKQQKAADLAAAIATKREVNPLIRKTYPGSSEWQAETLPKGHQLQLTTGQAGRTIRGSVDKGPDASTKHLPAMLTKAETKDAAAKADEIASLIHKGRLKQLEKGLNPRREREKLGQTRLDLDPIVTKIQRDKTKVSVPSSAGQRSREVGSQRINTSQSQRDRRRETNKTRDDSKSQR